MTDTPERQPNVNLSAPVGSIDMPAFGEDGSAYEIWPCHHCLPWHIEVVRVEGEVMVRAWHAIDCELLQEMLED